MSGKVRLLSYAVLGIVCGSLLLGAASSFSFSPLVLQYQSGGFNTFRSEAELVWFLNEKAKTSPPTIFEIAGRGFGGTVTQSVPFAASTAADAATAAATAASAAKTSADASTDYSSTNIQVAGVDEADVVKTDGSYIYLSKGATVYIVKAYPAEEAKLVAKIAFNVSVSDLFISGDKLVVFTLGYPVLMMGSMGAVSSKATGFMPMPVSSDTVVYFYNISDRANPVLERTYEAEGGYVATRMIGDYVYVVTQKGAWVAEDGVSLPSYSENGKTISVPATRIYYINGTDTGYSYTTVASIDARNAYAPVQSKTFLLGSSGTIYCGAEYLYLTSAGASSTGVHKIKLDGGSIEGVADGSVPGWVLNQFSMDEDKGYFRIATTTGHAWGVGSSKNNVYVLDADLKVVGRLEDLASGEQIYSARFMGDRLYLVTFKKVDPLFVIDLADPTAPKVLGQLKIPGYSNYLHPYDETHVIGLGKEAIDAEGGSFAYYQGIKLSLFDVSDVSNPREVAKLEIGDRGSDSPALTDHKAFLFSRERNLLVIPILEAKVDASRYAGGSVSSSAYGDFVYQGAYVFQISTDGIQLRGRITHIQGDDLLKSGYWFSSEYSVYRSLYIGDNLYTISGAMIRINSLSDLSELKTISLM
jgi:uncharacterized secreted protein with C-terminal beta-propeller domain